MSDPSSVPPTQPPAAPETDVNALREALAAARPGPWEAVQSHNGLGYFDVVGRGDSVVAELVVPANAEAIVAAVNALPTLLADLDAARERVRVVEGERDRWESTAYYWSERAESAEAAHAALVKVLGEYFDFDVDPWEDHDAACPAPEDVWRLHRDLKAALAGGAR